MLNQSSELLKFILQTAKGFSLGKRNDPFKIFLKVTNEISEQGHVVLEKEREEAEKEVGKIHPHLNPECT